MRERLWLALRKSTLLRKLYGCPLFAGPMHGASFLLMPSSLQKRLRVRSGPAKGLIFELRPRWEGTAWEGIYELPVQQSFVDAIKPGMIVFDVGANYGFYSLLAARRNAQVFAFEPDRENAETLAHHADLNRLADRIRIVPSAVFSYTGRIALESPQQAGVHGNARATLQPTTRTAVRVPCTTLDDFIASNLKPSLVKMDVEGAESDVLKGADRLFRVFRPILLCEIHDDANAVFAQDWLRERDYACLWLEDEARFPRHLLASPKDSCAG